MGMSNFADRLSALVALEMSEANNDPERQAAILERLLHATSFTISIMARGNAKTTEMLTMGAEAYLTEGAVDLAEFGKFINDTLPEPPA